jgi:hypothetical protein
MSISRNGQTLIQIFFRCCSRTESPKTGHVRTDTNPSFLLSPTQPSELVVLSFLLLNLFISSSIFLILFRVLKPALLSPKWLLLDSRYLFVHALTSVRHC